jgi:AcrR family transcriptional regulator
MKRDEASLGRPRAFDPQKALQRAMLVFWRKGYLGTSLSDLTKAMGINRPSLYAAFGNKDSLFRKALSRYAKGPSSYLTDALEERTARAVVEQLLLGVVNLLTDPRTPVTCMWVHGALSHGGDGSLGGEFAAQRAAGLAELRARFKRAIAEGGLPRDADPDILARYVQTVNFGLTVQASTGATRKELLRVVDVVLKAWPPID